MKMYAERGFGLWLVERKTDGEPLGLCGLVKREQLQDVDLGFAHEAMLDWGHADPVKLYAR